jgi:beta-glucanase (GH16 family)
MNLQSKSAGRLVAAGVMCAAAGVVSAQNFSPWLMTWSEEFDGTTLNPAKWMAQNIAWPHNNEQQYYSPGNARVSNGVMRITAERRPQGGRNYTSARIETQGRFAQMFGRFEGRMRLPKTQSLWPAFWLLPSNGNWPPEIDILELLGHDPDRVYFSNHWGVYPNNSVLTTFYDGPDFSLSYNTFAVDWEPGLLEFYVNGVKRSTHTTAVPNTPMFIILNTAVGGFWPGYPDATTQLPQYMDVDWVRVYRRIVNRGFEYIGPSGTEPAYAWARFGNATAVTQRSRTGNRSGKMFGNFSGGQNNSGVYQDMPAAPGQTWRGSGWFYNWSSDAMAGANTAVLNIEWRNAAGQMISFVSTPALSVSTPRDVWREVIVQGQAPAGTVTARLVALFTQPAMAAGAAFFDDMDLQFAPPACPADYNNDGAADFFDYLDFVADFDGELPRADFNGDSAVDFFDYLDFVATFDVGCA